MVPSMAKSGISLGTDACNKGTENVEWLAVPDNRHPFIPQNLYRMSGGADNTEHVRTNRPILG